MTLKENTRLAVIPQVNKISDALRNFTTAIYSISRIKKQIYLNAVNSYVFFKKSVLIWDRLRVGR